MRRSILLLAICLTAGLCLAADAPKQSFEGQYQWKQGGDGPLSAEFTPTGENTWKVKYRFEWNGGDYTWKGVAEGSLEDGTKFTGTATNGSGRTWDISGTVEDGVLRASHTETSGNRNYETGTLVLNR